MKVEKKKAAFQDERGKIIDIITDEAVSSVTLISSKKGAIRGNHYHKESVQYTFVLRGRIKYVSQAPDGKKESITMETYDLACSPPMESHAILATEDSELLILTRGPRSGGNYENDTYRLGTSLLSA